MAMLLDNDILARLTQVNIITGLILLFLGIVLAISAFKLTKLIRKRDDIKNNDKVFLSIKAIALAIILASLIVMIIE